MKHIFAVLFFVMTSISAHAAWDLNDVSYLMPLPVRIGENKLLSLDMPGKGGALLPSKFLGTLPPLSPVHTEEEIKNTLRVIAVRIDPCFPLPTPQSCQKQMRLVWQPIEPGRRDQPQTVDAALHSFYVLTDAEFDTLLQDIGEWKNKYQVKTQGLPLQIHPAWAREKDQSAALSDFNQIVRKYAGAANLSRVTAMVVRGAGDMWAFQGFSVKNGKLELLKIPRLDRSAQAFINFAVPSDHFERGQISPEPNSPDSVNQVIRDSQRFQSGMEDILRKDLAGSLRIENPTVYNPENMDCVSCHVAQAAREWIGRNRADIGIDNIWNANAYMNARYNLKNTSPILANTQVIRAFGYFGPDMAISQRIINESAEVADAVNKYVGFIQK